MLYFDDMAVWLRTKKGKLVRNIICCGIAAATVFIGFTSYQDGGTYKSQIEANKVTLAETNHQMLAIQKKIEDFVTTDKTNTYSAFTTQGPYVATKQTNYSGIMTYGDISYINQITSGIENDLTDYIDSHRTAWYPTQMGSTINYAWSFLTRTSSTVTKIPSIWQCTTAETMDSNMLYVLSIATADYNAENENFTNVKVHMTQRGYDLLNGNKVNNTNSYSVVGSIVPIECNENLGGKNSSYYSKFADAVVSGNYDNLKTKNTVSGNSVSGNDLGGAN